MKTLNISLFQLLRMMTSGALFFGNLVAYAQIPTNVVIQDETYNIGTVTQVEAMNDITVAGDNTTVLVDGDGSSGGQLILRAGNVITLRPGFSVKAGGKLEVFTDKGLALPIDNTMAHTAQYNGNISAIAWRGHDDQEEQAFSYGYDPMSRLKSAHYATRSNGVFDNNKGRFSVTDLAYDANGNIDSLSRQGLTDQDELRVIDKLTNGYTGGGNQLKKVDDLSIYEMGFKDGTNQTDDRTILIGISIGSFPLTQTSARPSRDCFRGLFTPSLISPRVRELFPLPGRMYFQ